MRFRQAKRILDEECLRWTGKPPSSNTVSAKEPNEPAGRQSWWLANMDKAPPPADSLRSKAYLRAYVRIMGPRPLFAKGLPLDDGYLHMDRGVMKGLLVDAALVFETNPVPHFQLTSKGQAILEDEDDDRAA